jgi:hypothetical protein
MKRSALAQIFGAIELKHHEALFRVLETQRGTGLLSFRPPR